MTAFLIALALAIATGVAAWFSLKQYRIGPYLDEDEELPPEPPIRPVEAPKPPEPSLEPLDFSTPPKAFKSTRILCDRLGLPLAKTVIVDGVAYQEKDVICATIFGESEFNINAINKNPNSTDHSLAQFNDGPPGVPPNQKWYIGPGKLFSSVEDVYANPERQVRYVINYWKTYTHLNPWYAFKDGKYKTHLKPGSRMWKLRT